MDRKFKDIVTVATIKEIKGTQVASSCLRKKCSQHAAILAPDLTPVIIYQRLQILLGLMAGARSTTTGVRNAPRAD